MPRALRYGLSLLAVAAVIGGATALVAWSLSRPEPSEKPSYVTARVDKRTLQRTLVVRGTLGYQELATLRLAANGRVTDLKATPGEKLTEGETVLAVNGRPVVAVKGKFPFWRDLREDDQGKDVRQLEKLLDRAGHNPGVVDEKFTSSTELAVRRWQDKHGFPVDGVLRVSDTLVTTLPARVGSVEVEVGEFITEGAKIGTVTEKKRQVEVKLSATDRLQVKAKQAATVEVSATGDSVKGTVSKVSTKSEQSSSGSGSDGGGDSGGGSGQGNGKSNSKKYPATITLKSQPKAHDGTDVRVTIVLEEKSDVLAVPAAAVVLDGEGQPSVRVLTSGGKVRTRTIKTGMADGNYVAVTSGLTEGETVVIGKDS